MKCALVAADGTVRHAERHPTDAAAAAPRRSSTTILDVADGAGRQGPRRRARPRSPPASPCPAWSTRPPASRSGRRTSASATYPLRDLVVRAARPARRARPRRARRRPRRGPPRRRRAASGTCCSWRSAPASPPRTWSTARRSPARTARPGEIGHIVVRPGGPPCGCGARGCLEAVASASAIGRRYAELAGIAGCRRRRGGRPRRRRRATPAARSGRRRSTRSPTACSPRQALFDPAVDRARRRAGRGRRPLLDPLRAALRAR